jgi:acetyltransferase-like isoleucine patch superfamily enzyme
MNLLIIVYKGILLIYLKIDSVFSWVVTWIKFKLNGVQFSSDFETHGCPIIKVSLKGKLTIGKKLLLNNGKYHNMIGRQQRCYFVVGSNATLSLGDYVGGSCIAIYCSNRVTIGNYVKIGGNTVIYDTDFHSLNSNDRNNVPEITSSAISKPVIINDYVFIGAHSTILKGVEIGKYSIIGAGSVVTKNIPANEIWAGNPAKFIRKNDEQFEH